ncbi:nuclear transport factor 2 family protein [Glaciibacter sp. 2TAF33]|uniref:nuclear transport factor 2 family protein n=1 Tax=Glaciibacter sp. 2TAF33 TaxID=3233015 RepID=UPI003F93B288
MNGSRNEHSNETLPSPGVVARLFEATNRHDLDALQECFATDYVNETPVHPSRGFVGRAQVGANWATIFGAVPDLTATVLQSAEVDGGTWVECEMTGTRRDGHRHLMRGVLIFGILDDLIRSARFYLEPVDPGELTPDQAVAEILGTSAVGAAAVVTPGPRS